MPWSEYLHFLHFLICLSSLNITYDYHSHHLKVHHGPCECIKPYVTKTHHNVIHKDLITLLLSCLVSFLSSSHYPFTNFLFSPHSDSHLLTFAMNLPQIQTPLTPHKFSPPCLNLSHFSASYSAKHLGSLTQLRPTPIQLDPTITLILYSTVPANVDILYSHLAQQHLCSCSTQTYQYYNTLPTAAQASYKPSETE